MLKSKVLPDETLIAADCYNHKYIGMDSICIATECLVRKHNIENSPGECKFYQYLTQDKNRVWHFLKCPKMKKDKDILDEYDFNKGVIGKYSKKYKEGVDIVVIDDVKIIKKEKK